jgi:hypothetical protein
VAKNEWDDSDQRIMVLNDEMLRGLNILDVTCLINYDMPSSRAAFIKSSTGADRFACMWTQFRDIAKEKVDPNAKLQRQVYLIILILHDPFSIFYFYFLGVASTFSFDWE